MMIFLLTNVASAALSASSKTCPQDDRQEIPVRKSYDELMSKPHSAMLPVNDHNPFNVLFRFSKTSRSPVRVPTRLVQFSFSLGVYYKSLSDLNNSLSDIYIHNYSIRYPYSYPPCNYFVVAFRKIVI
ncbi:MAG: hypothetical protein LBD53_04685 [Tannerella sp.]|nr:hypothetical protein [Tannerella sp.]